jgi:hypothetical protein
VYDGHEARVVLLRNIAVIMLLTVMACGGGKPAKDAASSSSSEDSSEVRIEYVPIAIPWVKRHVRVTKDDLNAWRSATGKKNGDEAEYKKERAPEVARRLADDMLSRMQASTESLDAIAESAIKQMLGPEAISDPKRRKAVSLSPSDAANADLPPDAKEALASFAKKAKPGDVVDSPLGSGVVLVVARAVR